MTETSSHAQAVPTPSTPADTLESRYSRDVSPGELHVVVGAGQIGLKLAAALGRAGARVRLVRRGPAGAPMLGVQWCRGDATDAAFMDEVCEGARSVYNCTNPPDYAGWDGVLQPLYRAIWTAAGRAGARLVQLDNLYMYGRPEVSPFDERTPMRPCSAKGELRRELARELMSMHEAGEVDAVVGRASDFFGPATPGAANLRPDVLEAIRKGSRAYVLGDPDQPHGYSYAPDVAHALAILGTASGTTGRVWHLPTSAKGTTRALLEAIAAQAGSELRVTGIPTWALRVTGVFSPLMAALAEMNYQFQIPYVIDDGDFCREFNVGPTPLPEAIARTLEGATTASGAQTDVLERPSRAA